MEQDQADFTRWEDIPKAKISQYSKKEDVTERILQAKSKKISDIKSKQISVLSRIRTAAIKMSEGEIPFRKHGDLYNLVSSVDLLVVAHKKLSKNKGAMTPGSSDDTADNINMSSIIELSTSIKKETFTWSRTRRIQIPKAGSFGKKSRPLGMPDYRDKLVQEVIRMILDAIYEPQFDSLNCNFGFRPNRSCGDAIEHIRKNSNGINFVIEGDVQGAFPSLDFDISLAILKKSIKDRKFLKLIYSGYKAGILENGKKMDSLLGIPQGGIASSILYNVYNHEFDKAVYSTIFPKYLESDKKDKVSVEYNTNRSRYRRSIDKLDKAKSKSFSDLIKTISLPELVEIILGNQIQIDENLLFKARDSTSRFLSVSEKEALKRYNRLKFQRTDSDPPAIDLLSDKDKIIVKRANVLNTTKARLKKQILAYISYNHLVDQFCNRYLKLLETQTAIQKSRLQNTTYLSDESKKTKLVYVRYADDWLILLRGNYQEALSIKSEIATILWDMLKLTLNEEKTKITDIRNNKCTFLGFEIFYQKNKKTLTTKNKSLDNFPTQRYGIVQFHPDAKRLETRFLEKKYIDKKFKPREVGFLTILKDHEIVEKFNQFMLGLGIYYYPHINYKSRLNRWHYYLYFSCLKTLATKHRVTISHIIKNGYTDLSSDFSNSATDKRIVINYNFDGKAKRVTLMNYKEFMYTLEKIRVQTLQPPPQINDIDMISLHKANVRTAFKLTSKCSICESTFKLQNHHIKPIKHPGGKFQGYKNGFDKLVASLNRKQITICRDCHKNIHSGKYNGMSLNQLYDLRLVAPESYIKFIDQQDYSYSQSPKLKLKDNCEFNDQNKTYLNKQYQIYLQTKTINQKNYG